MVINLDECTGCNLCQIACKDEHVGNNYPPWTKSQPDTGHFWIKVHPIERGQTPKVRVTYLPVLCMQCDNASCMKACPEKAITKREDGIVWIDPEKCTGCRLCEEACPYGVIYYNAQSNIAQKCTGCVHLIESGNVPRCVDACPRDAIIFGDENDPIVKEIKAKSDVLNPEYKAEPRVYYSGLPKPFIAGTVVDPATKEVIPGTKVIATDLFDDKKLTVFTDEFGDFWIKGLERDRKYLVEEEKDDYEKAMAVVTTDRDKNLGDIFLRRKSA